MAKRVPSEKYLLLAQELTTEQSERLFSRMGNKLGRRFDDSKIVALEALAMQLEIEDENLKEWRERLSEIRKKYRKQIENTSL